MNETITVVLVTAGASYVILYYVIRRAVAGGILDADRRRAAAEAERQLAIARQHRTAPDR